MSRPEFEAVLWRLAPATVTGGARERLDAHEAIMRAFDAATGRRRYWPECASAAARDMAEAARRQAEAVHGDTPAVRAGRRAALTAALMAEGRAA